MVGRHVTLDLFREIRSRLYQAEPEEAKTILQAFHKACGGRFLVNVVKLLRVYGG
jgi:hypothetical protein